MKVLTDSGKPMTVAEITEAALPLTGLKGATPKQVFYSVVYGENRKKDGVREEGRKGWHVQAQPEAEGASGPRLADNVLNGGRHPSRAHPAGGLFLVTIRDSRLSMDALVRAKIHASFGFRFVVVDDYATALRSTAASRAVGSERVES